MGLIYGWTGSPCSHLNCAAHAPLNAGVPSPHVCHHQSIWNAGEQAEKCWQYQVSPGMWSTVVQYFMIDSFRSLWNCPLEDNWAAVCRSILTNTHTKSREIERHTFIFEIDIFQLQKVLSQLLSTCDFSVSLSIMLLLSCKKGEKTRALSWRI